MCTTLIHNTARTVGPVLIIFRLNLQTSITAQILSVGWERVTTTTAATTAAAAAAAAAAATATTTTTTTTTTVLLYKSQS